MRKRINKAEQGFSLMEMMVVVGMMAVLGAMAIMSTVSSTYSSKANNAMDGVITQLRTARQMALHMRRNVLVTITTPNKIQLTVETLPGEAAAAAIPPSYLNDGAAGAAQFYVYPGLPDTPMAFGNSTALTFTPASGGSAGLQLMFSTAGSLVGTTASSGFNTVGNSNPVNASIFIAIPGQQNSARAVTVLGSTGRVRSYSWTGSSWQEQQ
jgi:prepilin-type N-terminal cleavage/methylation domain-containing protein